MKDQAEMQILVMPHVHSDLCWPDIPEACINSCMLCVDDTVTYSAIASDYKFTMEHMMFLKEYLRRNPDKRDTVRRLLTDGNLDCGASHSGPTELTLGGEGLIRQLYFGKLWLENEFGIGSKIVWNVDAPGHTAQLPQILAKAGVECFFFWKEFFWDKNYGGYSGPHYFIWEALDGTSIIACSLPYGYGLGDIVRIKEDYDLFESGMQPYIEKIYNETTADGIPPYILIADGNDCARPSFAPVLNINTWNQKHPDQPIKLVSSADFAEMLKGKSLPVSKGDMPCWWDTVMSFETGRVLTDRRAEGLVISAECAVAFAAEMCKDYEVPRYDLQEAWEARLFAGEHNEGGNMGNLSDSLKDYKTKAAAHLGARSGRCALGAIAANIDNQLDTGFIIFNSLSWRRNCRAVVTFEFQHNDLPPIDPFTKKAILTDKRVESFVIEDSHGREVPSEMFGIERGSDGGIKKASVIVNIDLDGGEYRTFKLRLTEDQASLPNVEDENYIENDFFRVEMDKSSGALLSIYDKKHGRELLDTSKYLGAELVTNEDLGHDETEEFTGKAWRMRDYAASDISVLKSPVRTVLKSTGDMIGCTREIEVVLYPDADSVDINVGIEWQGVRDLNMRIAFPFDIKEPNVHYGIPFGWVKYGDEHPECTKIHPSIRGVRDWFDLSNSDHGITVVTDVIPLELFDRVEPASTQLLAQPILVRSTYSCYDHLFYNNNRPIDEKTNRNTHCQFNKEGVFNFRFSLHPYEGAMQPEVAARKSWEMLNPAITTYIQGPNLPYATIMRHVKHSVTTGAGDLPLERSFVKSCSSGVVQTVTKLAEDGNGIILRMYDASGKGDKIRFDFFKEIREAFLTDIVEKSITQLHPQGRTLEIDVPPFSIETVRVVL